MPSSTSAVNAKSTSSRTSQHSRKSSSPARNDADPPTNSRRLSIQALDYEAEGGKVKEVEIEETALDSDDLYDHLYGDLGDDEAPASRLCSSASIKILYEEDGERICKKCKKRFADCPHVPTPLSRKTSASKAQKEDEAGKRTHAPMKTGKNDSSSSVRSSGKRSNKK